MKTLYDLDYTMRCKDAITKALGDTIDGTQTTSNAAINVYIIFAAAFLVPKASVGTVVAISAICACGFMAMFIGAWNLGKLAK